MPSSAFQPSRFPCPPLRREWWGRVRGFTLTELLVVLAIIIVLAAIGIPTISALTGSRSVEAGQNVVSAALVRARGEAIKGNQYAGAMFFFDPETERHTIAFVSLATNLSDPNPYDRYKANDWVGSVEYQPMDEDDVDPQYLADRVIAVARDDALGGKPMVKVWGKIEDVDDAEPEVDGSSANPLSYENEDWALYEPTRLSLIEELGTQALPAGVGVQVIRQGGGASDRYASTGLILFDPSGRLVYRNWSVGQESSLGRSMRLVGSLGGNNDLFSQFGVVLYRRDAFLAGGRDPLPGPDGEIGTGDDIPAGNNFTPSDGDAINQLVGALPHGITLPLDRANEEAEEMWLDVNTVPYLVNRYSGVMVASE